MDINERDRIRNDILKSAFTMEATAIAKYMMYKSIAEKASGKHRIKYENYIKTLEMLIENEREHFEIWAKELDMFGYPVSNLMEAMKSEFHEATCGYDSLATQAKEIHDVRLEDLLKKIGRIENLHWNYLRTLSLDCSVLTFGREDHIGKMTTFWRCKHCGNVYYVTDKDHPENDLKEVCDVCGHKKDDFELVTVSIAVKGE